VLGVSGSSWCIIDDCVFVVVGFLIENACGVLREFGYEGEIIVVF